MPTCQDVRDVDLALALSLTFLLMPGDVLLHRLVLFAAELVEELLTTLRHFDVFAVLEERVQSLFEALEVSIVQVIEVHSLRNFPVRILQLSKYTEGCLDGAGLASSKTHLLVRLQFSPEDPVNMRILLAFEPAQPAPHKFFWKDVAC